MTFFVGTSFDKTFRIKEFTKTARTKAQWIFEFANDDKVNVVTTDIVQDEQDILITFTIPKTHFAVSNIGDCVWQVMVYEDDDHPIYLTDFHKDKVRSPIRTKDELI